MLVGPKIANTFFYDILEFETDSFVLAVFLVLVVLCFSLDDLMDN